MKRSFFGYDVKKTDELINTLQNQNDIMADKLSTLTTKFTSASMELEAAKAEIDKLTERLRLSKGDEELVAQLRERIQELEKEKAALRAEADQKLADAEQQIKALTDQMQVLATKKQQGESADDPNMKQIIGSICERVYVDMEKMRQSTADKMERHMCQYADILENYTQRIQSYLSGIKAEQGGLVSEISQAMSKIFENLKTIELATQKLEKDITPMKDIADEMSENLRPLINAVKTDGDIPQQKPPVFDLPRISKSSLQ